MFFAGWSKKSALFSFWSQFFPQEIFWNFFHQIIAEWWEIISFKSDWNWNLISSLSLIVNNMFYPGASLTDNCCNSNVETVDNSSYHVSWYPPDLRSYVVLQICQGLGIVVIDPFLEVPPEEVVTWVQVSGVEWPREVGATRNESITRKIPAKEFQRSVWTIGRSSILLVDNCVHIYSPFPPQFLVRDGVLIFWGIPQCVPANSEYSQELWLSDVDHCGFCGHLPHFLSPEIWPPNVELSLYQEHCSCQNLSSIAAVSGTPWWFLSAAA